MHKHCNIWFLMTLKATVDWTISWSCISFLINMIGLVISIATCVFPGLHNFSVLWKHVVAIKGIKRQCGLMNANEAVWQQCNESRSPGRLCQLSGRRGRGNIHHLAVQITYHCFLNVSDYLPLSSWFSFLAQWLHFIILLNPVSHALFFLMVVS